MTDAADDARPRPIASRAVEPAGAPRPGPRLAAGRG